MYSTQVFFTPLDDCLGVKPPIRKGVRNDIRVKTRTPDDKMVKESAVWAMDKCYGIAIEDLDTANQFEY